MLLMTYREWLGCRHTAPQNVREATPPKETLLAYVTYLPLGEAIERVKAHEIAYAKWSPYLVVEHNLISVAEITDLTEGQRDAANLGLVEDLKIEPSQFD